MNIGRLSIGFWDFKEAKFIWFEYDKNAPCGCKFLTICNLLFIWFDKECQNQDRENRQ